MDEKAAYAKADCYHSEYLMNIENPQKCIMLGIGLNYIRFAIEEPHLFCLLFLSYFFTGMTLLEMIDAEELAFLTIFLFVHGYASIIANNSLEYDEELIKAHMERAYTGAILAAQEETK